MSETNEKLSLVELKEAEDSVLHGTLEAGVEVCGQARKLHPLPVKYAKKVSSLLNKVVHSFNNVGTMKKEDRGASLLAGQEELLTDCFTNVLMVMAEHYRWQISVEEIEESMTVDSIRTAVMAQVDLNGKSDFLLLPSRLISQVLFQTTEAVDNLGKEDSTSASESPSGADLLN